MKNTVVSFRQSDCIERNIDFQNLLEHQTRVSKTIMINVSFKSCLKMIIHPDEVSHVTTELIRLCRDHQFINLPKLKHIVGHLADDVSKAPSRSSRKKSTENRNENLPRMEYTPVSGILIG